MGPAGGGHGTPGDPRHRRSPVDRGVMPFWWFVMMPRNVLFWSRLQRPRMTRVSFVTCVGILGRHRSSIAAGDCRRTRTGQGGWDDCRDQQVTKMAITRFRGSTTRDTFDHRMRNFLLFVFVLRNIC